MKSYISEKRKRFIFARGLDRILQRSLVGQITWRKKPKMRVKRSGFVAMGEWPVKLALEVAPSAKMVD